MADEQYRWLNRETAERLLNGEPPEAADPATRDQAERLARTLGALSSPPPSAGEELPGEAAALAAFRKAREERAGRPHAAPSAPSAGDRATTRSADAGLIRIGAPGADGSGARRGLRWARPVRYGLAAALTVGMFGGAAVVAATGVLPASSAGSSGSDPAASAPATATPERPRPSPPPEEDPRGGAPPEGDLGKRPGDGETVTGQGNGPGAGEDGGTAARPGDPAVGAGRGQIASACRALRDGKKLQGHRKRVLENAAGGSSQVGPYCENVLAARDRGTGSGGGTSSDDSSGPGSTEQNNGDPDTRGKGKGKNRGNGNGNGNNGNQGTGNGNNGNQGTGNGNNGNQGTGNGNNGNNNGKGADKSG
ncbi:hypothetical protein ACTWJ9_12330 [Streptomyces sp. GDS52]|uniref:hypothetical protein n=1 Tax=Streptomyces sp. GDS52 TaxID=3406419 RepID=UPI003FD26B0F